MDGWTDGWMNGWMVFVLTMSTVYSKLRLCSNSSSSVQFLEGSCLALSCLCLVLDGARDLFNI